MSENRLLDAQRIDAPSERGTTSPGRVVHDDRGTAVWDWDVTTTVLSQKTTDELITTLEPREALSLEGEFEAVSDRGGDPYNRPAR
jgi:hypothetical protein